MRVRVVSFGPLRSRFPEDGLAGNFDAGATVRTLLDWLQRSGTVDEAALKSVAVAVNHEYAHADQLLADGDEIAILPPVSGGIDEWIQLVRERIDSEYIVQAMKAGADGAIAVFDGIVRDNTRGRSTLHLDYEAYEDMALSQMRELRENAMKQFDVRDIAIIHRLGRLFIGETSVLIVVASAHRGAAFDACRWVIDTLKKTVPIWKQEHFVDGAVWADGESFPEDVAGVVR